MEIEQIRGELEAIIRKLCELQLPEIASQDVSAVIKHIAEAQSLLWSLEEKLKLHAYWRKKLACDGAGFTARKLEEAREHVKEALELLGGFLAKLPGPMSEHLRSMGLKQNIISAITRLSRAEELLNHNGHAPEEEAEEEEEEEEDYEELICPIRALAHAIDKCPEFPACIGPRCAWWSSAWGCCAIKVRR